MTPDGDSSAILPAESLASSRLLLALCICAFRTGVLYILVGKWSKAYIHETFDFSDHIVLLGAQYVLPALFELTYLWGCAMPATLKLNTQRAVSWAVLLMLTALFLWNFGVLCTALWLVARTAMYFHTYAETAGALLVLAVGLFLPLHLVARWLNAKVLPRTLFLYSKV